MVIHVAQVGEVNDVLNGDISVGVLSSDSYMCDNQNADCRTNDIKARRPAGSHIPHGVVIVILVIPSLYNTTH